MNSKVAGQCTADVPSITVNLTGHSDTTWTSMPISRNGNCCSTTSPDVCIHFYLTLDSGAAGMIFSVSGGTGATYYTINCSTSVRVGDPVCITGTGPWNINYCKPGNNPQVYTFKSIPKPWLKQKRVFITPGCTPMLAVENLIPSTVRWKSISGSAYDANLSCTAGCDTTYVTMGSNFPSYVDYQVCGTSLLPCYSGTYCDTVRVTKISPVSVKIGPRPAIVCSGSNTTINASVSGGVSPFAYKWSTGATTQSVSVQAGIYWVKVTDAMNCNFATDTIVVYNSSQIKVDAGKDTAVCTTVPSISLKGSVSIAAGGTWSGTGIFSPDNTSMNPVYTFSANDKSKDFAKLYLTTTGNGSCAAVKDSVIITLNPLPAASVISNSSICIGSSISIGGAAVVGSTYSWISTPAGFTSNSANPNVSPSVTTTYTLTETNANGCVKSNSVTITVNPLPNPNITGNNGPCEFDNMYYSTANSGNSFNWAVSGGTIISGQGTYSVDIKWGKNGSGIINLTETNPITGCLKNTTYGVTIYARPGIIPIFH